MKNLFALLTLILVSVGTVNQSYAENVTFDASTKEGRAQAYAVLNQSNAKGNAQRLVRNLTSLQRSNNPQVAAQATKLVPELNKLIESL